MSNFNHQTPTCLPHKVLADGSLKLTVDKNVLKRRLGVLGNLYSGTSKRFANALPSVL
jgi:hypothetical protein